MLSVLLTLSGQIPKCIQNPISKKVHKISLFYICSLPARKGRCKHERCKRKQLQTVSLNSDTWALTNRVWVCSCFTWSWQNVLRCTLCVCVAHLLTSEMLTVIAAKFQMWTHLTYVGAFQSHRRTESPRDFLLPPTVTVKTLWIIVYYESVLKWSRWCYKARDSNLCGSAATVRCRDMRC